MHKICWCEKLKEREHLEVLGIDGYMILKFICIFYSLHCNITIQKNPTKCSFSELVFQFMMSSTFLEPEGSSSVRLLYILLQYGVL